MRSQRGLVLLLTMSMMLVLSLLYSIFLIRIYQLNRTVIEYVESRKATLILNSALNLLDKLLTQDDSREVDYNNDIWREFIFQTDITELIGVETSSRTGSKCRVYAQIIPAEGKLPLNYVVPLTTVAPERAEVLIRLFEALGFDNDGQIWTDSRGNSFNLGACQTVASLVDFMDLDSTSVKLEGCSGFESEYGYSLFGNFKPSDFNELLSVPGFTADRIGRLMPFTRLIAFRQNIDLNTVSDIVLKALIPDIQDVDIRNIFEFRTSQDGPFTQFQREEQLRQIIPNPDLINKILVSTGTESNTFENYVKYACGQTVFMARGYTDLARLGQAIKINRFNSIRSFTF